ncbi:MAG: hypothetical protein Greene041619_877 [Candidatus Peregrinibacteria bacterium Greene0416_19]|nr:MAG: hypothetical protein Greene041619_877 [Candidatus Peregrinibacteria bacterium Greene0416_19]
MAVPTGAPADILPYASPAYASHKEQILAARKQAKDLGLLTQATRERIFAENGIVCDRRRDSADPSVSQEYFSIGVDQLRVEAGKRRSLEPAQRTAAIRSLLAHVLAIRLSIAERPLDDPHDAVSNPIESYTDLVNELEEHCQSYGIPSALPNMFLASSLFTQLKSRFYRIDGHTGMMEFFSKLTELFAYHDRHLHAITTHVMRQGKYQEALELIRLAATMRGVTLFLLFEANPLLAETYVQSVFELGNHENTVALCNEIGLPTVAALPGCAEKYLRSLTGLNRLEDIVAFLEQHPLPSAAGNWSLRKACGVACESVGWWFFGLGRYAEGLAFLDRFAKYEIGPQGRTNMNALYLQLLEGQEDAERIAAFKKLIGVA